MGDEEAELKDVLLHSLTENGILPKLQAQLKAAVYIALENHNYNECIPPSNRSLKSYLSTEDGLIITSLVVDFMRHFKLDNTLNVLKHEASLDRLPLLDRDSLCSKFSVQPPSQVEPVVCTLLTVFRNLRNTKTDVSESPSPGATLSRSGPKYSRIPTLQKRNSTSALSRTQNGEVSVSVHNDASEESLHVGLTKSTIDSQSAAYDNLTSDRKSATISRDVNGRNHIGVENEQHQNLKVNSDSSPLSRDKLSKPNGHGSTNKSPRGQTSPEYDDDFDSPRSLGSQGTIGSNRAGDATNLSTQTSQSMSSSHDRTVSSPGGAGILDYNIRPKSECNSPSIIRVYAPPSKQSLSNAASSDVDEDDEIPEILRADDSIGEGTNDQTVDSERSLDLDYVEDVKSIQRSPTLAVQFDR